MHTIPLKRSGNHIVIQDKELEAMSLPTLEFQRYKKMLTMKMEDMFSVSAHAFLLLATAAFELDGETFVLDYVSTGVTYGYYDSADGHIEFTYKLAK